MSLQAVALGALAAEVDHGVREEGGNNMGPRIAHYRANADPPISVPVAWCALVIQWASDVGARALGVPNPLDDVRQEALVLSYYELLEGQLVEPYDAIPGDIVLMKFGSNPRPWDHIGLVSQPPRQGEAGLWTIEGNTSSDDERDGDAVAYKPRGLEEGYPIAFARWGAELGD